MKTIIAGGRDYHDYAHVKKQLEHFRKTHVITEIVSGGAKGADALGEQYAEEMNIKLKIYHADWEKNGRAAGPIRNQKMGDYADQLVAVWDGKSKGTKNMIDYMNKLKKPVFVIWVGDPIEAHTAVKV